MLKTAIIPIQEQIEAIAPQGWTLGLDNFSLGDVAPSLSGFQVRLPPVCAVSVLFRLWFSRLEFCLCHQVQLPPVCAVSALLLKGARTEGVQLVPESLGSSVARGVGLF